MLCCRNLKLSAESKKGCPIRVLRTSTISKYNVFFSLRLRAALPPTEKDIKTTDDSFIFCATFLIDKLLHVFSQTNVNGVFVVFKLQLSNHIMEECPKTCEQCVYHDIGCAFQVIYISWVSKLCRFVLFWFFLLCFLPLVMISYYK